MSRRLSTASFNAAVVVLLMWRSVAFGNALEDNIHVLGRFDQDLRVAEQLQQSAREHPAQNWVFRHVNVVDVERGAILPDMRVSIEAGHIAAIIPDSDLPTGDEFTAIPGRGLWLVPGLADMHVHQLASPAAQRLLDIATGVTTVRDMDGFPWMLSWRQNSRNDTWLAPDMLVAGHIIAAARMGPYATVVHNEMEARCAIRDTARAGYDFVKVHNVLPLPIYDAVLDEADRQGIHVVGHVPHGVSVQHALARGQWTIEHFKGYIDDRTLKISSSDWISPTCYGVVWNVPTFYAYRMYLRGKAADEWLATPEARFASVLDRQDWLRVAGEPVDALHAHLIDLKREVLHRLLSCTSKFVAGTDSGGGYPFMVPGFSLHEELHLLHSAGLSSLETLRSATIYAARAADRTAEFGQVAVGLRANLLLTSQNPLRDVTELDHPVGVMLRGRWLPRAIIDRWLDRLADIEATVPQFVTDASTPDSRWIAQLIRRVQAVHDEGYVFPGLDLDAVSDALENLGYVHEAARLREMGAKSVSPKACLAKTASSP